MTTDEHMIENALFAVARGKTFDEFLEGNTIKGYTERELALIGTMVSYVLYTLFDGVEDFREECDPRYYFDRQTEDSASRRQDELDKRN